MTIEFPDEPDAATAPAPGRTVELRRALPWSLPAALALVALFLPVTTTVVPSDTDALGTFRDTSRISLQPFGRYTEAGSPGVGLGGPAFGWVWVVLLAGFVVAGGWSALRPGAPWPGVLGAVASAAGVGAVASLWLSISAGGAQRASDTVLAVGAWVALAAAVVGLVVAVLAVRRAGGAQSANAKAGG